MIEGQRNEHGVPEAVWSRLLRCKSWDPGPWPISTSFSRGNKQFGVSQVTKLLVDICLVVAHHLALQTSKSPGVTQSTSISEQLCRNVLLFSHTDSLQCFLLES